MRYHELHAQRLKKFPTSRAFLLVGCALLPKGPGREMLDALIVESEEHIAEIKREVIQ